MINVFHKGALSYVGWQSLCYLAQDPALLVSAQCSCCKQLLFVLSKGQASAPKAFSCTYSASLPETRLLQHCRQGDALNAADVAASLLQCLYSAVSSNPADTMDEARTAVVRSALGPILSAVQALVQTSSGQP